MNEVTLYKNLLTKAPTFTDLHKKYNPVLQLVNILIGTIPNCDPILEIWPTGFRTYNLLVPNLLNLPNSLLGSKTVKKLMGLAMYESSLSSGCNYCTAHCCSFAIRRGLNESTITGQATNKELAVINFARKMGQIPCNINKDDFTELQKYCNSNEIEAILMGTVLMGFLNKFMDAIGVELEQESIDDVSFLLKNTTWEVGKHANAEHRAPVKSDIKVDNILTYIKVFRLAPGAMKLEKRWLKGVPNKTEKINEFLNKNIGYDFPVLNKIKRPKSKKVIATVLRDNFSESDTHIGLKNKIIHGLIFSTIIENISLKNDLLALAEKNSITINVELQKTIKEFSNNANIETPSDLTFTNYSLPEQELVAFKFTHQISTSPTNLNNDVLQEVINQLKATYVVELVTWISLLQALHRLHKLPIS